MLLYRSKNFTLNTQHPLARGLVFAGLGANTRGYTYVDSGPYHRHGKLMNMNPATDWIWIDELDRWALDFGIRGSTDYVQAPTLAMPNDWTIAVWIRPGSTTDDCYIWDFGETDEAAGVLGWQDGNFNIFGGVYPIDGIAGNSTLPISEAWVWHHVAWTKTGTNLKGFLNGRLVVNRTITTGDMNPSANLRLGRNWSIQTSSLHGMLADFILYIRPCKPDEIKILANKHDNTLNGLLR